MDKVVPFARDLAELCRTWPPDACLLANIRAADLASLADWVATLPAAYLNTGDLTEMAERHPNGLTPVRYHTAMWLQCCAHAWVPEARILERYPDDASGSTREDGIPAGDLRRFADFVMQIPGDDSGK